MASQACRINLLQPPAMEEMHFPKSSAKPPESERHQAKKHSFQREPAKAVGKQDLLERNWLFSLCWFYFSFKSAVVEWVNYFLGQLLWSITYFILWTCKISKSKRESGRFLRISGNWATLGISYSFCWHVPDMSISFVSFWGSPTCPMPHPS